MMTTPSAQRAGTPAPENDEAGRQPGSLEQATTYTRDCAGRSSADQPAVTIDGEARARLLVRAQALAARFPHLGVGPDLVGLSPGDLRGVCRFLRNCEVAQRRQK